MSDSQPHFPLKVAFSSMSSRTCALIEYYIQRSESRYLALAENEEAANIIMADIDHPGTTSRLPGLLQREDCVIMVLAVGDRHLDGAIVLQKPLDSAELEQAAEKALKMLTDNQQNPNMDESGGNSLLSHPGVAETQTNSDEAVLVEESGMASVADPAEPSPLTELMRVANKSVKARQDTPAYFRTTDATLRGPHTLPTKTRIERYKAKIDLLCGPPRTMEDLRDKHSSEHRFDPSGCLCTRSASILSNPDKSLKAVQLKLLDADIFLLPTLGKAYISVSLEFTSNVRRVFKCWNESEVKVLEYTSKNVNELVDVLNQSTKYSFGAQSFCWLSALFSANGRLPLGFDLDSPCTLLHWPNFTRVELIPNCMEIAAVWSEQPASVSQIVKKVRCEPRHVTSFLYAACTINAMTLEQNDER